MGAKRRHVQRATRLLRVGSPELIAEVEAGIKVLCKALEEYESSQPPKPLESAVPPADKNETSEPEKHDVNSLESTDHIQQSGGGVAATTQASSGLSAEQGSLADEESEIDEEPIVAPESPVPVVVETDVNTTTPPESEVPATFRMGKILTELEKILGDVLSAHRTFLKENLQQDKPRGITSLLTASHVLCGKITEALGDFENAVNSSSGSGGSYSKSKTVKEYRDLSIESDEVVGCKDDDNTSDKETQTTFSSPSHLGSDVDMPIFTMRAADGKYEAHGRPIGDDKEFMVLAGSTINQTGAESMSERVRKERENLESQGVIKGFTFEKNHAFRNDSLAASVIIGSNVKGKAFWKVLEVSENGIAK